MKKILFITIPASEVNCFTHKKWSNIKLLIKKKAIRNILVNENIFSGLFAIR